MANKRLVFELVGMFYFELLPGAPIRGGPEIITGLLVDQKMLPTLPSKPSTFQDSLPNPQFSLVFQPVEPKFRTTDTRVKKKATHTHTIQ